MSMLLKVAPEQDRYQQLADVLHEEYGMSLDSFPQSVAKLLLDQLPESISVADPSVLQRIVSACSIGETLFMRHEEQFTALRLIAPTLPAAREGRKLAVWSAGCATGEEAYSLAALLSSSLANEIEVLGTDVNPESIRRAQRGTYGFWSLRGLDVAANSAWLRTEGLRVEVDPRTRKLVHFEVQNLFKDPYPQEFDIIFCRNVLLYFSDAAAQRVLDRLAASLRPGGVLFLGYTDAQPRFSTGLETRSFRGVRYFQKPAHAHGRVQPLRPPGPIESLSSPEAVRSTILGFDASLGFARGLAGQGLIDDALEAVRDLCTRFPLEVEPNLLGASIALEAERTELAIEFARRAGFLSPNQPLPHYLMAVCLHAAGEIRLAAQRFALALMALSEVGPLTTPVDFGGGLTGLQLRRMIEHGMEKTR